MLEHRFSREDLLRIIEQAAIYECACPAQVCKQIQGLRALYEYQARCLEQSETDRQVHQTIAAAARQAHALMEACLDDILRLEGWDRATLTMPASLQKRFLAGASTSRHER